MRREKRYIYMDSTEHRLAIVGMNHFRNHLIQTGKPTEDVDALLLKLWKAKVKHCVRRIERSARPGKLSSNSAGIEQWHRPN